MCWRHSTIGSPTKRRSILAGIALRASPRWPIRSFARRSGLPPRPIRVYDPIQQLAIIDDDVLERFQVDTIELGRGFALEDKDWADWTLPDGTPCQMPAWALPERQEKQWVLRSASGRILARMPDGAIYFEQCYWPFIENDDFDRLPEALGENMWCAVRKPAGAAGRLGPMASACLPRGPASCGRRPIAPSSACSAAICWKSASSSIATTNS